MHVAEELPHTEFVFWKVVWDQTRTARRRRPRVLPVRAEAASWWHRRGHRGPEGRGLPQISQVSCPRLGVLPPL